MDGNYDKPTRKPGPRGGTVEFRRFTADYVRAILGARPAAPTPTPPGQALPGRLPEVPTRTLDAYCTETLPEVA